MKKIALCLVVLLPLILADVRRYPGVAPVSAAAGAYSITEIGIPPGYDRFTPVDLNLAGQVVGDALKFGAPNGGTRAFMWKNGTWTDLGTLGGTESRAAAINNAGQVAGSAQLPSGQWQAVRWDSGVIKHLTPEPNISSEAHGINNRGDVVGAVTPTSFAGSTRATRWTMQGTSFTVNNARSIAFAINDSGIVVGQAQDVKAPFHYIPFSTGVGLPLPAGQNTGRATAINVRGEIIGVASNDGVGSTCYSTACYGVRWPGGLDVQGWAYDINARGQIVGIVNSLSSPGKPPNPNDPQPYAFLWQGGQLTDLTQQVAPSGWHIDIARAINDVGQVLGEATRDGKSRPVLLTPVDAPTYSVNLSSIGPGTASVNAPLSAPYKAGTPVTLTATNGAGSSFLGWRVDGVAAGRANPLQLLMDSDHTVVAAFGTQPTFPDVAPGDPANAAIAQLTAQGIVRGYSDGQFYPDDTTLRAQMAAMIARALGWDAEDHNTTFPDQCAPPGPYDPNRNCVDPDLWRNVGTMQFYAVAKGYQDGTYAPRNAVLHAQAISFITRAMVTKGYWVAMTTDNPALYPNVTDPTHRLDIATYVFYAGALPGSAATDEPFISWDQPCTRAWFALTLTQAVDSIFP